MIKNKKGFTLIELIVVVAIIGILVAVLVPSISGQFDNAKETAAKANAKTFYSASQTSVTTILAGWEVKGPVTQGDFAIPSIYYESGEYRVYFGKNTADSSGEVEPISNAVRTGYVSADETDTATSATDLQTIKEINKHMRLYLGDNSKLTTDNGGYQLSGGTIPTPPPQPPQPPVEAPDSAKPADVTMKIKTTGNNATGTFAGREYFLEVTGLTKDAKYEVTVGGVSKGEFTATGAVQTVDLKGAFAPVVIGQTTTHKAEVRVVALNPATGVTAEKGSIVQDLSFYDGDGSTATPYLICDAESLEMLSFKVKNDKVNFAGKIYKQIASIDMSPVANFVQIGISSYEFKGTYDGGAKADGTGYEIKNLTIDTNAAINNRSGVGLFGYAENATFKNIRIGSGSVIKGQFGVGGIVGSATSTTIENCQNSAAVSGISGVGGIAGDIVKGSKITQSSNTGDIKGERYVGGIAGQTRLTTTITNCQNSGTVTATGHLAGDNVGGIVGSASSSLLITQSSNTGDIKGERYVGGIAGHTFDTNIINCQNSAAVSGSGYVGGITGEIGLATITQSSNTGAVTAKNDVGGVVGRLSSASITFSFNTGRVEGEYQVGGVVGTALNNPNPQTIAQVYNTGSVTGSVGAKVGGVIGYISSFTSNLTVANSYNAGEVKSTGISVGGVIGSTDKNSTITLTNCFNTGNVTGRAGVGGAIGAHINGGTLTNFLFKNTVVVTGMPSSGMNHFNIPYTNISEFLNATGANRKYWDDNGKLKNEDGTLMAGPNPGGA